VESERLNSSVRVERVVDRSRVFEVHSLEVEYFAWVNRQLGAEFGITLDVDRMLANDMDHLEMYLPPTGGLFLAVADAVPVGMIFLTQLREGDEQTGRVGQIRRMYVRDGFRRRGIARALFETAIAQARAIGYAQLLLESPKSWAGAHALYRDLGFDGLPMYPESEVPEHLRAFWVFMGLRL
jgi:GNAT superfamily N-acetyltransferase